MNEKNPNAVAQVLAQVIIAEQDLPRRVSERLISESGLSNVAFAEDLCAHLGDAYQTEVHEDGSVWAALAPKADDATEQHPSEAA